MYNDHIYKPYNMNELPIFPIDLEILIPEKHIVRVINEYFDNINISPLKKLYPGGGASSYHPRMMLKLIVYAYTQRIYSCRNIAKALRENIYFKWIAAMNEPGFQTINRFRLKLAPIIAEIFADMVLFLEEKGYVKMENYFVDGTKIEADANRYSFVWKKNAIRYKEKLQKKFQELFTHIDQLNEEENAEYGDEDLEEMGEGTDVTSEMIRQKAEEINERLKEDPDNKELKKAGKFIEKEVPKLEKYEKQEIICGNRGSYSKTDEDATYMRMKDNLMDNRNLRPAYNVLIGTENQFVVGFSTGQNPSDTSLFKPHMEIIIKMLGKIPENTVGDSAFGSEENYNFLEKLGIGNYLKFFNFHNEKKKKFKENIFRVDNMEYDILNDEFICPAYRRLQFNEEKDITTKNGYVTHKRFYQCENCEDCELREQCHKSENNRRIQIGPRLENYKQQARENLNSDEGIKLRKKRGVEVEATFGQIKRNMKFRRFNLRGLEKVNMEWGLVCMAHNFLKMVH